LISLALSKAAEADIFLQLPMHTDFTFWDRKGMKAKPFVRGAFTFEYTKEDKVLI
jgi:hypothetical protein